MNGIIIIGGHVQALGIARILGKLDIPIVVMDITRHNLARHSKYCKEFILFDKNDLMEKLIELGKNGNYKEYTVFPTNDLYVGLLSQHKRELSNYFTIASDDWNIVEKCYNKRLTYNIANRLGIPIADTWMPNNEKELKQLDLCYPVIIKPAVMHSFYSKLKKKVFICNDLHELLVNYKLALTVIPAEEIIIQAIITGGSEHLYSACFLFDRDKEIQSFVARRSRQHPPDFGRATTFAELVDNEELIEVSKKLLKFIKYKGVCEVEYKYDPISAKYLLLEINPRTWKWHSIAESANINLLENYCNVLHNKEIKNIGVVKKACFRHLLTDIPTKLQYIRKGLKISKPKYPIQYAVWCKSDIKPALYELLYLPYLIFER